MIDDCCALGGREYEVSDRQTTLQQLADTVGRVTIEAPWNLVIQYIDGDRLWVRCSSESAVLEEVNRARSVDPGFIWAVSDWRNRLADDKPPPLGLLSGPLPAPLPGPDQKPMTGVRTGKEAEHCFSEVGIPESKVPEALDGPPAGETAVASLPLAGYRLGTRVHFDVGWPVPARSRWLNGIVTEVNDRLVVDNFAVVRVERELVVREVLDDGSIMTNGTHFSGRDAAGLVVQTPENAPRQGGKQRPATCPPLNGAQREPHKRPAREKALLPGPDQEDVTGVRTGKDQEIRVGNGKFTFICPANQPAVRVIDRLEPEPWVYYVDQALAVLAAMRELDAARFVVQAARDAVDAPTLRPKELLQSALTVHDSIVSDREPPSEWCMAASCTTVDELSMSEHAKQPPASRATLGDETLSALDEVSQHSLGRTGEVAAAIAAGLCKLAGDPGCAGKFTGAHSQSLHEWVSMVSDGGVGDRWRRGRDAVWALLNAIDGCKEDA